jgi:hypothetical protein
MKVNKVLIFILFCMVSCTKKAEKSIFIIPENYQGTILVVYEIPNSSKSEYNKKGTRIYRIPSSGILETEFKPNYGTTTEPEYYYGDFKYKLDYFSSSDWKKKENSDRIVVSGVITGKDKKDFLIFTVGSIKNDSIGDMSDINKIITEYFKY